MDEDDLADYFGITATAEDREAVLIERIAPEIRAGRWCVIGDHPLDPGIVYRVDANRGVFPRTTIRVACASCVTDETKDRDLASVLFRGSDSVYPYDAMPTKEDACPICRRRVVFSIRCGLFYEMAPGCCDHHRVRALRMFVRGAKACARCDSKFIPARADSVYCSSACRQAAYRERKKA